MQGIYYGMRARVNNISRDKVLKSRAGGANLPVEEVEDMGRTYADTLDDQMAAAVLLRRDDADYKWLPGGMRMSERITEADSYFIGADFGALAEVERVLRESNESMSTNAIERALDGLHPRQSVRKALESGSRTGGLLVRTKGPRNANLYHLASSPQVAVSSPVRLSEFASSPIGGRTHTRSEGEPVRRPEELPWKEAQ
jgi:hypothetical protein